MINTFSFPYPWWFIFFCIFLALGYAVFMYYKDKKFDDQKPWFTGMLGGFRFLATFFIVLLLLSPFVKTIKEDIKQPLIVIASDRSGSIAATESSENLQIYNNQIHKLAEDLSSKFEVKTLQFASDVHEAKTDSIQNKSTNISQLFKYIDDNYADQNLGAVIVGTDGIYNEGSNPLHTPYLSATPIYTIALGDTTQKKDVFIQNILYNNIAYLGDKFPIQVDVSAYNCEGHNAKITLEKINGGTSQKLVEENININAKNYFNTKTFTVDATSIGIVRYRVKVSSVDGEQNTHNNVRDFYVEILDARQKILLLGNAPHPDLGALKSIITDNKNYDVTINFIGDFKENLANYNMVIFHNLPSETNGIASTINQLDKLGIPRIFIIGMQTSIGQFNSVQKVVNIIGNSKNTEDIQADFNTGFTLFTTTDALKNNLKYFPPLKVPFGEYQASGKASVYLTQNIKKLKTSYPLIAFDEKDNIKTAIIAGEGLWRWRMFDYLQNKNYDLVKELINKTILLTSVKSDKRKFRVNTSKNLYKDNEQVQFDAQLYNDSYELINSPDVKLIVKNEEGKEFAFTLSKTDNYYTLNAGLFPQGSYNYTASTQVNGKNLTASGRFSCESLQLELFDLTARHGLLKSISEDHKGTMVYPKEIANLKDLLIANNMIKPVMYESRNTTGIINLKWLFFLIITLLSTEWFIRRYSGNY